MKNHARHILVVIVCALTIVAGHTWMGLPGASHSSARVPVYESLSEHALFWMQRQYGNPDADFNERLWLAYDQARRLEESGLNKSRLNPANAWSSQGPVNISGRVRALAIHPSDPNTIYAGAASGGVWKSTSFGADWTPLTDGMPALAIGALAIDPTNPNRIYAGTGEPTNLNGTNNTHGWGSPAYTGVGVLTSDDAGQSWSVLPWPNSRSMIHRIIVHPEQSDTVFVASTSDLWRSTNKGQNWSRSLSGTITDLAYRPGNPSVVYVAIGSNYGASANGIYISETGGGNYSWRKLVRNFPSGDSTGRILFAISPTNTNRMYAALTLNRNLLNQSMGRDPDDFFLFLVSNDAGETWERKSYVIPKNFGNSQLYYDFVLGVLPSDPDVVFLGGVDLWRSKNGGNLFSRISDARLRTTNMNSPNYIHADQHAITFKPDNPGTVIIACDGGVHISSDQGDGWTMRNNNLINTQFYSCNYDRASSTRFYGGTQDQSNQRQSGSGDTRWTFLGGGDGGSTAADPTNQNIFYIVINGDVNRSTNGGSSFKELNAGMSAGDRIFYWRPILLHPNDRDLLFSATQYVYKMRNPGTAVDPSWVVCSPDLTKSSYVISDMAISPTNSDVMYVVTGNGKAAVTNNLRSIDVTWTDISAGLPGRWLSRVSVDWNDPQTAYVAVSGYGTPHVYKTFDGGQSWQNISGDLPDIPVGSVVRSRTDVSTLFAATDLGVWYTTNGGTNWRPFGSGLPNLVAYDMKMLPNGDLLVGSYGRGMWTTSSVTSVEPGNTAAGVAFTLGRMYPNPVTTGLPASIPFSLARRSDVELQLYTMDGKLARTLAKGRYAAGDHAVRIDTDGLNSAMYLYTMTVDGKTRTGKMIVMR